MALANQALDPESTRWRGRMRKWETMIEALGMQGVPANHCNYILTTIKYRTCEIYSNPTKPSVFYLIYRLWFQFPYLYVGGMMIRRWFKFILPNGQERIGSGSLEQQLWKSYYIIEKEGAPNEGKRKRRTVSSPPAKSKI